MVSPWANLLLGQQVGDYAIAEHIKSGGFGIVFKGVHVSTKAEVAVKVLDPGQAHVPHLSGEFDNEGVLLKKLNKCSHVITLIDSGEQTLQVALAAGATAPINVKYHVLTLASGVLSELTEDPALLVSIEWSERIAHWRGVIKGVHQMHLKAVSHRDLKAENVLLMAGARNTVEMRVADLGKSKDTTVAGLLPPDIYAMGRGDRRHAAPEFLWFQGGHRPADYYNADLFALGSVLTELITGHPMTAIALGSWQNMLRGAEADRRAGITRDLAVLRPQFTQAVSDIADEAPLVIRHDLRNLLAQVCSPVPSERLPKHHFKRFAHEDGLNWLLRRADIFLARLNIEAKRAVASKHSKTGQGVS